MISFDIPQKLNGEQLRDELKNVGIIIEFPIVIENKLWLEINAIDEQKAAIVVKNHVGVVKVPTIEDKLANAGITLNELREALGL